LGWAMDTRLNAQRPRGSISRGAERGETKDEGYVNNWEE